MPSSFSPNEGFALFHYSRCEKAKESALNFNATFHLKLHKDAGATTASMGTSMAKLERYWSKSHLVTDEMAKEWFNIRPTSAGHVTPMVSVCPEEGLTDAPRFSEAKELPLPAEQEIRGNG